MPRKTHPEEIKIPSVGNQIPNKIHLVWFGSTLPDKYRKNLEAWKQLNPDFEVSLWCSSRTLPNDEFNELNTFCETRRIQLVPIENFHDKLTNYNLIQKQLSLKLWEQASDTLRFNILHKDGGYYFDTDIKPKKPLQKNLKATYGFHTYIQTAFTNNEKIEQYEICFLAFVRGHTLLAVFMRDVENRYAVFDTLSKTHQDLLTERKNLSTAMRTVGLLSGGVFQFTLFPDLLDSEQKSHIHFQIDDFVDFEFDGAWQSGMNDDATTDDAELAALEELYDKISAYSNEDDCVTLRSMAKSLIDRSLYIDVISKNKSVAELNAQFPGLKFKSRKELTLGDLHKLSLCSKSKDASVFARDDLTKISGCSF